MNLGLIHHCLVVLQTFRPVMTTGWTVNTTGLNLVNLISFRGIKEILTLTKGKESIKGKETVDTLQSAGWPDMRKYFLC